jgi:hypothetical protein
LSLRDFLRATPKAREERRIEFLGEQDGENERRLKDELRPLLEEHGGIERAYLVRAGLQSADQPSVVLCLISRSGDDPSLVRRIAAVFEQLAPPNVYLDVGFLTAEQEKSVQSVCRTFYQKD